MLYAATKEDQDVSSLIHAAQHAVHQQRDVVVKLAQGLMIRTLSTITFLNESPEWVLRPVKNVPESRTAVVIAQTVHVQTQSPSDTHAQHDCELRSKLMTVAPQGEGDR
jgi:hypothetical protein